MSFARKCDVSKPFALISYSHKDKDQVQPFASELIDQGYNIWIDENEIPKGTKWDRYALVMIRENQCKAILFFRSESSVVSANVRRELIQAEKTNQIDDGSRIKVHVVDVEMNSSMIDDTYRKVRNELTIQQNEADAKSKPKVLEKFEVFEYFEEHFDDRYLSFCMLEKDTLQELRNELTVLGIGQPSSDEAAANQPKTGEPEKDTEAAPRKREAAVKIGEVRAFGDRYPVKNQNEAMTKLYEILLNRQPEQLPQIISQQQHVSLKLEKKAQFNSYAPIRVRGQEVFIGTSFSMKDKLKELYKCCELLGMPSDSIGFIDWDDVEHRVEDGAVITVAAPKASELASSLTDADAAPAPLAKKREASFKIDAVRAFHATYPVKNQNEAMSKLYDILLTMYPEQLPNVVSRQQHVSMQMESKAQFNSCAQLDIFGQHVYVGTSFSMKEKLKELAKLCAIMAIPNDSIGFIDADRVEYRAENGTIVSFKSMETIDS